MVQPVRKTNASYAKAPAERLLVSASEVFTRRGYAATSVREIVENAGVTKPVLYYHFGNKEGLYRALVDQLFREFEVRVADNDGRESTAEDRVIAICLDVFHFVEARLDAVRFFYGVYFGPPQSAPFFDFEVFPQRFRKAIEAAVRRGMKSGELRRVRVDDVVSTVEGILNVAVEAILADPQRHFSPRDLKRLLAILFRGISNSRSRRTESRREIRS